MTTLQADTAPATSARQAFEGLLPRYVNTGCLSRRDVLAGLTAPSRPFRRNAAVVSRAHAALRAAAPDPEAGAPVSVDVAPYDGAEPAVRRMADALAGIEDDLVGAFVHGSLGTGEVIPYSDFDALVVLKDDVFAAPERLARAALGLYRSRAVMLAHDPLQHHGWFVLSEAQLAAYPEHYLPRVLLDHAKAILPGAGRTLVLRPLVDRDRQREAFLRMVHQVVRRPAVPQDLYEAKVMLSQFMLLPALYLQARSGEGVFKRDSFEAARPGFEARDWAVMDEVSALRAGWSYPVGGWRRRLFTHPSPVAHRLAKRYAPPLPAALARVLTTEFHGRMRRLALLMAQRVLGMGVWECESAGGTGNGKWERENGKWGFVGPPHFLLSHSPFLPFPHTPILPHPGRV